jgi:hypothetical protein
MPKFIPSQIQLDVERWAEIQAAKKALAEEEERLIKKFKKFKGKTVIGLENKATIFEQEHTAFLASVAKKYLTEAQYKKCQRTSKHLRVRITPITGLLG